MIGSYCLTQIGFFPLTLSGDYLPTLTVENTTDNTFEYFNFNISLVDKDGVVVETQNAYTENWKPGDKHRFEFSTDKEFDKIEVETAEWS